jgi:hypothetical protein
MAVRVKGVVTCERCICVFISIALPLCKERLLLDLFCYRKEEKLRVGRIGKLGVLADDFRSRNYFDGMRNLLR